MYWKNVTLIFLLIIVFTFTEYLCHLHISQTNEHGFVPFFIITILSFPHSWFILGFVTRVTRRVALVEQELFTLPEYLSSPAVISRGHVAQSLVFSVVFCRSLCVPLWFLFWLLYFLSSGLRLLITSLVTRRTDTKQRGWKGKERSAKHYTEVQFPIICFCICFAIFIFNLFFFIFFHLFVWFCFVYLLLLFFYFYFFFIYFFFTKYFVLSWYYKIFFIQFKTK